MKDMRTLVSSWNTVKVQQDRKHTFKISVSNSKACAHQIGSLLSFYCWNAPSASVLIDLIISVEMSYGVKSA